MLQALQAAGVRYWLAGGWGVDALVGHESREHRDLDLAVDATTFDKACRALLLLGFTPETDWLPVRLEFANGPGGWVDLHPIVFDDSGDGVQQGLDGQSFAYPAEDLTMGSIQGHAVPCISVRLQRAFHSGYDPRPQDLHDLRLLSRVGS